MRTMSYDDFDLDAILAEYDGGTPPAEGQAYPELPLGEPVYDAPDGQYLYLPA